MLILITILLGISIFFGYLALSNVLIYALNVKDSANNIKELILWCGLIATIAYCIRDYLIYSQM